MKDWNKYFINIYQNFNERNIDFVIDNMTPAVKWANGMDGGFVNGHDGVRDYWNRQFKLVSSHVTPLEVREENGEIMITVHQVVHDRDSPMLIHKRKIADIEGMNIYSGVTVSRLQKQQVPMIL
jgi:hypothetical protein